MIPARNTRMAGANVFKLCRPADFQKAYKAR
uniref:Uncharacterized protein n=1 Tax=Arundo donax TaxID=35708 RepID=A0A0A8Y0G6_ARUDO